MTLTDRVVELFKAHPNTWLRERRIMQAGGTCGFRSRITDARKRGLDIINKVWRETGTDGITYTCSAYMYRPASLLDLAEATQDNAGDGTVGPSSEVSIASRPASGRTGEANCDVGGSESSRPASEPEPPWSAVRRAALRTSGILEGRNA